MSRILVISPHPDDEAIGCGGTLRSHVIQGDEIHVIFLTSGEKGGHGKPEDETAKKREREATEAASILGFDFFEFWRIPDGRCRANLKVVKRVQSKIKDWMPKIIYVTHSREMLPDHRAAARIVRGALFGADFFSVKPIIRMFEVWTPIQQIDDIVDITPFIDIKIAAIRAYKSQCDVMKFDDASLGLSRFRGEMHSWPGGEYAEIFQRMKI